MNAGRQIDFGRNGGLSQQIKSFDGFVRFEFGPNIWWKAKWINIHLK